MTWAIGAGADAGAGGRGSTVRARFGAGAPMVRLTNAKRSSASRRRRLTACLSSKASSSSMAVYNIKQSKHEQSKNTTSKQGQPSRAPTTGWNTPFNRDASSASGTRAWPRAEQRCARWARCSEGRRRGCGCEACSQAAVERPS